ncbi:leukocyte tyrosine kinase receptor-like, partial [Clarias magur]
MPETAELTRGNEEGYSGPALTPDTSASALRRPFCLLLMLILLVLSFLGSWAVVHLSLAARENPFRISSSYDQPGEQETATYDPLFITNCTMETSRNVTFEGRYHCRQGQEISLERLCDFTSDCPQGDDEGEPCRQFLNGSYCSFEEDDCGWQMVSSKSLYKGVHLSLPKSLTNGCPSSGSVLALESQFKGQRGSVVVRSPLFLYPLRNAPCMVQFKICGSPNGLLSLWIIENSTGPEGQRSLWNSSRETKVDKGWRLVTFPLYGLVDSFYLQFSAEISSGPEMAFAVDNFTLTMNCFLETNGEFPPVVSTSVTPVQFKPTNHMKPTTPGDRGEGARDPLGVSAVPKWFFRTCGATGPIGPTPSQCSSSYRKSNVNVSVGTKGALKGIQMWRVPETGLYRITAYGAAGGRSVLNMFRSHGVYIAGDFRLHKDEVLYILVGQQGEDACSN